MADRFMPAPDARIEYLDEPQSMPAGRFMPSKDARIEYLDEDAEAPEVSKVTSVLRGAAQGATLGFADEIAGIAESALSDKTYRQARDESRAAYREAQAANPISYGAGQLAGGVATSFVPGAGALNLARLGTGIGAQVARGALSGAIAGVGEAEGPEGKMMSLEDMGAAGVRGGALGGVVGGALGTAAKAFVGGAAQRDATRILDKLTLGAPAKMRDRVAGKAGEAVDRVYELSKSVPGLAKAARKGDVPEALEKVKTGLEKFYRVKDDIYDAAASVDPGVTPKSVANTIGKLQAELMDSPDTVPVGRMMQSKIDDVEAAWGNRSHITLSELRQFVTGIGRTAFAGNPGVDPTKAAAAGRELYARLLGHLDDHFESVAKANPKLGLDIGKLRENNKKISTLMNVQDALEYKATREATAPTTLRSRVGQFADIAGMAASLGSASAVPWAAVKAARYGAPEASRIADTALATLVSAAERGNMTAKVAQDALESGVPRSVVNALVSRSERRRSSDSRLGPLE
jgi:hypothetical protein